MNTENKIVVNSSTKNLALVRNFVESQAGALGLTDNTVNQIVLSVDEACSNIIKYTHKFDDNKTIEVSVSKCSNDFVVEIFYEGEGFDPNKLNNPDMVDYFKHYKVGGLGIPMIKRFMNKIEYAHILPDSNKLILIKSL